MWQFNRDIKNNGEHKFEQLRDEIIRVIESGGVGIDEPLPTINDVSDYYNLSKVTVSRAYNHLKKRGIIANIKGKFYIVPEKVSRLRLLLIFNKLEDNKRNIHEAIQTLFDGKATIDLQVYYSNYNTFESIIRETLNKYDYYLVMPHFYHDIPVEDYWNWVKKIKPEKLFFIDRIIPGIENFKGAVVQDFYADMYLGLEKTKNLISKYKEIRFVMKKHSHHPIEATKAVDRFCSANNLKFSLVDDIHFETIARYIIYIVTTDKDLANLIKKIKTSDYEIGRDVGIIAYNETIIKELLNITTFSTDFYQMGKKAAEMILNDQCEVAYNTFDIIVRDSL